MDYKHYIFSNECKLDLLEFYNIAESQTPCNKNTEAWKLLLPKNELLVKELKELKDKKVVDLTNDVICVNENAVVLSEDSVEPALNASECTVNDFADTIKEHLQIENQLSYQHITKLLGFGREQLNEVFILLSELLDKDIAYKFGNSIISYNNAAHIRIITQFVKYILVPKLFLERNSQIHLLFLLFLNNYPKIVCEEFSYKLSEIVDNTKYAQDYLSELNSTHKQLILKEIILHCAKLEKKHFAVIDCLLSNEIDVESIQKLIELLMAISSAFSNDKIFGKLLLNILSNCKGSISHFEEQFVHIINLHRSIWKGKLSKMLSNCIQDNSPLSQSMRY